MKKNRIIWLLLGSIAAVSCGGKKVSKAPHQIYGETMVSAVASYDIKVREPSGLTLGKDNQSLWTVSDRSGSLYQLSFKGELLKKLPHDGDDLEGIAYDKRDDSFLIVEEASREVVKLSKDGIEKARYLIPLKGQSSNSGLEGICFDKNFDVYVLNEKQPKLFAKLNKDFSVSSVTELSLTNDISGIAYDEKRDVFWIVSDSSWQLLQWSPSKGLIGSYNLPYRRAEGIAVDTEKDMLYIVSDLMEKLYIYKIN